MKKEKRILSIGAHPDDADTYCGGLLSKLRDKGWQVRLLSVTDGSAGTYHAEVTREELKLQRRSEHLIRYIRTFAPDVILTNRTNDYHADHRNVSLLVQDASFLLTVPKICPDTPYLEDTPAILFWGDDFMKPYPHQPDIIVPLADERMDLKVKLASCHECQYFDWMYWPHHTERIDWPREKQVAMLSERYHAGSQAEADRLRGKLTELYGVESAAKIRNVETYEISEYSGPIDEEFLTIAKSVE